MGQYQKAAEKTVEQVGNATAIIVTDVHTYADKVNSFAIEIAKKTGKPLGLESLSEKGYVAVQALEHGDINKKEFVDLLAPDISNPNEYSATGYLGLDRARGYYAEIADAIKDGVKVRPMGTSVGYDAASLDTRYAPIDEKLSGYEGQVDVDFIKFQRGEVGEKLRHNPKEFFNTYFSEVKRQFLEMSDEHKEKFADRIQRLDEIKQAEAEGHFKRPDDYKSAVRDVYETLHPLSGAIDGERQKLQKIEEEYLLQSNQEILTLRRAANKTISDKAADLVKGNNGAVIVLGRDHTVKSRETGFDVDDGLRAAGIDVAIVDPMVPRGQQDPEFATPMDRIATDRLLAENKLAILRDGDPNRFTVQLEDANVMKVAPTVSKPTAAMVP